MDTFYFCSLNIIILCTICFAENSIINNNSDNGLMFICKSGALLDLSRICDGRVDCYDGSDEHSNLCCHTLCNIGMMRCHNGACISKSNQCNGIRDCADGSDEEQCGRTLHSCS